MQHTINPGIHSADNQPKEAMKVDLLTGEEVLDSLSGNEFQTAWVTLYRTCKWATIFQSPDYIMTWYRYYKSECLPILVVSYDGARLTGILNLCILKEKEITGTGGEEAYYHTWLSEECNKESFIKAALTILKEYFPKHSIRLYQLPPHTPIDWLEKDARWNNRSVLIPFNRPLIKLNHPDLAKLFTKKQFKENRNKLKRLGEVRYEKITDINKFHLIFDELAAQYDLRKGATLNLSPFRDDPSKKKFLLALFEQGLLHVTVLTMNEEIVASLVATVGKNNWVHGAGINTHAPIYAHCSPGFLSFILLAQQLAAEQYEMFDLSTGDQAFKARMANVYDKVYELRIHHESSNKVQIPEGLKKICLKTLTTAGIDHKRLKAKIKREKKLAAEKWKIVRQHGLGKEALNSILKTRQTERLITYKGILQQALATNPNLRIHKNSIQDILDYAPTGSLITRWEFLESAMRRFEAGEQAYTISEEGILQACIWKKAPHAQIHKGNNILIPEGALAFDGIYCHPSCKKKFASFFRAVMDMTYTPDDSGDIYLIATNKEAALAGLKQISEKEDHVMYQLVQLA